MVLFNILRPAIPAVLPLNFFIFSHLAVAIVMLLARLAMAHPIVTAKAVNLAIWCWDPAFVPQEPIKTRVIFARPVMRLV